jgi:4-amino-4-deoxy-L-arabinose transferase-like glycosyltransferase
MVFWIVAAVALVARIVAAITLDGFQHPHLEEWDGIAHNMLEGRGFTYLHHGIIYYSQIAPLSAWISAASYWLTGSIAAAMLLQIAAGATLAVVAARIAERLFGGWVAPLSAGLLVAVHPGLTIYSATRSHSLAFDALFFALTLLQAYRLHDQPTVGRSLQLGAILGVGMLSRATIIVFLPIAALWLLATSPRASWRTLLRCGLVAGLCAAAIVAPWSIRNSLLHGRFVFMLTTDSEVFWRGNNPLATGNSYIDRSQTIYAAMPPGELEDLRRQPNELAQAAWFQTRARAFIRDQPAEFVRLTLQKFVQFWSFSAQTGVLYPRAWFQMYMAYYVLVVVLAAIGAWRLVRVGEAPMADAGLLSAFLLGLSALQSFYYVESRHRWAVESLLIAISGGGVARLWDLIGMNRRGSRPAA